jgi:hypothetical protein
MQEWYDKWRHQKNLVIRDRLQVFKEAMTLELDLEALTDVQRVLIKRIQKRGYLRYETVVRKVLSKEATSLRKGGWLEMDNKRRWVLTLDAELVFEKLEHKAS